MAVRSVTAAAVFTAAAAVYALVSREHRLRMQLARERASHRLMDGCLVRDLQVFQERLEQAMAEQAASAAGAGRECTSSSRGGPR